MANLSTRLRLGLAQLNYKIGDLAGNFASIERAIARARDEAVDLLVFSELALTGYPPLDLVYRSAMLTVQDDYLAKIAAQTDENFGILVGYVESREENGEKQLLNAAALCSGGKIVARIYKNRLMSHDVADDCRYFSAGDAAIVHAFKGARLGIFIGEDIDFVDEALAGETDYLINLAAVPFALDQHEARRERLAQIAAKHARPLVFVNQVGGNGELIFDGNSAIFGKNGRKLAELKGFEEDFGVVELTPVLAADGAAAKADAMSAEAFLELAHRALVLGLRDYVHKSGFERVVLGLSGGMDSALVATLAVDAFGAENVLAVGMPSRYSTEHSVADARKLAENLGVRFELSPIEPVYQAFLEQLAPFFGDRPADVTEENLQARIRGMKLMALSNKLGHLVLTPGNKSEAATGYATLYGDMNGAVMVIGDVPKTLVYRIGHWINAKAGREVIPENILTKAPSAELSPGQVDQDSLPPYDVLDAIIESYMQNSMTADEIVAQGYDEAVVTRVISMIHRAEYKRAQAPPVLRISSKAFGSGWRYPLVANYFWRR